MDALAQVEHIDAVDIGGLLRQTKTAHNKDVIFQEMIPSIRGRHAAVPVFSISNYIPCMDARAFAHAINPWRRGNPGKKLRTGRLILAAKNLNACFAAAVLTQMNGAWSVHLELDHVFGYRITPDILRRMLRLPSLKEISIADVTVNTMDVFDPLVDDPIPTIKPALERLELTNIELHDPSSMVRFLQHLHDSTHPLARSLRHLKLVASNHSGVNGTCDEACARELHTVLRLYVALDSVEISFPLNDEPGGPFTQRVKELRKYSYQLVPSDKTLHLSSRNRARNAAFLSVMKSGSPTAPRACQHLDTFVLSQIFEFSAPLTHRTVTV